MSTSKRKNRNSTSIKLNTFELAKWLCDNESHWVSCPKCGFDCTLSFDDKSKLFCHYCNYSINANAFFRKKESNLLEMCSDMHEAEYGKRPGKNSRLSVI
jgi:hypothetical protein